MPLAEQSMLSSLGFVLQKLASPVMREIKQIWKVDNKLIELQSSYEETKALLDKWEGWQIDNDTLKAKLQELNGYCYDTEDLLDDFELSCSINFKGEAEKPEKQHSIGSHIFKSLSVERWKAPHKIVEQRKDLEDMSRRIQSVLSAMANYNSNDSLRGAPSASYHKSSLLDCRPFVAGTSRDQDKHTIVLEYLISLQCNSSGVSIIGMDGLGKTALARTIMVDERIKKRFPLVLSACASDGFQMEDIVRKLIEDHSRLTLPHSRPQTTRSCERDYLLKQLLRSERSLIILDDLWEVTDEAWEYFRFKYLESSPGCKILITTRNPKVAKVTETTAYYLKRMTDEDCKQLIVNKANLDTLERENWARDIGVIAEKCKGMPILANKLGIELSKKWSEDERRDNIIRFKTMDVWQLREFREVFPCFKLNEPKLPADLKRCFAYCSLFPPNHEFNRDEFIRLWEAEVFVQPEQRRSSQRTGSECFDDLLSRAILQPPSCAGNNQPIFRMHEFNHKFAQLLACKAFQRIHEGEPDLPSSCKSIRHLSLSCQNTDEPLLKKIRQCKGLRTFLLLHQSKPKTGNISCDFFRKLERLRLLGLSNTNIGNLLRVIPPLKHLRYLDLSGTDIKTLPELSCLGTLQILKLENCSQLDQLPKDLNKLISLIHLHVNMKSLARLPSNMGMLTNLETLSSFIVGKDKGYKVAELKNMKHLREICISWLENIRDREEAQAALLNGKQFLRRLVLEWNSRSDNVLNAKDVLKGLQPHSDLRDLVLRNYSGSKFPKWLSSPSCRLLSIYLDSCLKCQILPSLGQLRLLKTLVIGSAHSVKAVDKQFRGQGKSAFPCLESLEFRDMQGLEEWNGLEAEDMPCLRALKIIDCPYLSSLPSLNHLVCLINLEISNCPGLPSLPELPSSLSGESGKLFITYSALVKERCQVGRADWPKIKYIPCVEIDSTKMPTRSPITPPEKNRGIEHVKHHMQTILENGTELLSRLRVNFRVGFFIVLLALFLPGLLLPLMVSSKRRSIEIKG